MVEVPGSTTCLRVETPSAVTAAGSEYSAPLGNQPAWVTRWLERNGIVAYYFTGDAGLGPTRVYRDAERDGADIWGFPMLHMGKEASLEEMGFDDLPIDAVRDWLLASPTSPRVNMRPAWFIRIPMARSAFSARYVPGWIMPASCRQKAASAGTP